MTDQLPFAAQHERSDMEPRAVARDSNGIAVRWRLGERDSERRAGGRDAGASTLRPRSTVHSSASMLKNRPPRREGGRGPA